MPKKPDNHRKPWSKDDEGQLTAELKQKTPTRVIGLHLGRTTEAIQGKANKLGISLKPTNQPPTKKK